MLLLLFSPPLVSSPDDKHKRGDIYIIFVGHSLLVPWLLEGSFIHSKNIFFSLSARYSSSLKGKKLYEIAYVGIFGLQKRKKKKKEQSVRIATQEIY